ncbi:MAG: LptF/LptG family permease [Candidatus Saganbacteria bacterium]|nr:LptF/LptG family permease [Candidatus Saganbacteria bacterium]
MSMVKTLDRYISREFIDPFLFGLGSFTAILSASMIMFELVRAVVLKGMPMLVALQLFIFKLPGVMVYIFPMATLLGVLLAFSRLSHDSEITAFKASGISLYRIVMPILVIGFIISLITLSFYEVVVPQSNEAAKNLLMENATQKDTRVQQDVFVPEFERGALKRIFYCRKMQGPQMEGVIVQEFNEGKLNQIINANQALWQKEENSWLFKNGIIYLLSENGEYKHIIRFDEERISIKYTPQDFYIGDRNPEGMNTRELKKYIDLKQKMGAKVTDYKIQLNMKIAIPFACLVFALLGAPLGLSPRRASSSVGLGVSIIIIFFYYIAMFIGMSFGELEVLPPWLAAWSPNLITAGIGWFFLKQAAEG